MKKLYVGNFPYSTTADELQDLFEPFGTIHSLDLIQDRETGRSRGFAFVEMDDPAAQDAIAQLNGIDFGGRTLRVNVAKPPGKSRRMGAGPRRPGRRGRGKRGRGRDRD